MKKRSPIILLLGGIALTMTPSQAPGATPDPAGQTVGNVSSAARGGVVEGRVFNPLTGEYIRNAEIRVQGTEILVLSARDGRYRIVNAPVGNVTVDVTYIGYRPASTALKVLEGGVVTCDFDLQSTLQEPGKAVVALDKFTVSANREGAAKAIMEQRSAMTIKNVIATDTFGAMVEGNVGDLLQYAPGLQIIYSAGEPSTVSMGGMDSKYGALMVDGVRTSGATRAPALGSYSAYATDTIEVNKTNAADMDADAPAGSINMRSKSAFQRQRRYFSYEITSIYDTFNPLTLGKINGPGDGQSRPMNPSVVLDFSDVYLEGKLGVVVNLSQTNSIAGSKALNFTFNAVPTTARPEPVLLTNLLWVEGRGLRQRWGGGLNVEYKFTPRLTLALRGQAAREDSRNSNRNITITATRASLAPASSEINFIAGPTANNVNRVTQGGGQTARITNTHSFNPQLLYEGERLNLDATFAYTRRGQYFQNARGGGSVDGDVFTANLQLFGVGWALTRTNLDDLAFNFEQTAGPDLFVLNNWRATSVTNNIVRSPTEPTTRNYLGQINVRYNLHLEHPTYLKAGLKSTVASFFQTAGSYSWTYVGPTGDRFQTDLPVSVVHFDPKTGGNFFTKPVPFVDRHVLGVLQREHPEYFIPNPADATNAANLFPDRYARENLDAAYLLANSQYGRLMLQGGVRYERTENESKSYERGVLKTRAGEYGDTFFSGAARYRFTDNLMAIASFSQSIQRANLNSLSGVLTVNDTSRTGVLPNPELKPEHGNNYAIRLEQYFEPVGTFSVGVFRFDITDLHRSISGIPAEDIGLDGDYPGYTFTALSNVGDFSNKGIEFAYTQQLTFLPGVFKGLGVFGNFNRFWNSNREWAYGAAPKTASGGITFRYRRLNLAVRGAWKNETFINATNYTKATLYIGTSLSYRITDRTTLTLTGRNVNNQEKFNYDRAQRRLLNAWEGAGVNWVIGVKGVF